MRARTIAVLGITAYGVFLAATFPARLVLRDLSIPGALAFHDAHGTLWRGSARATLGATGGDPIVENLRWRFLPARLASGRLAFAIDASGPALQARGEVARGFGALEARDVDARGDAGTLAAVSPLAAGWRPEGSVHLTVPAFGWDGRTARGQARLEWRDAALALSGVRPLGSYRLEARAEGGPATLSVDTLQGPLHVAGTGAFTPPDGLAFSGAARADGPSAAALEPLLNLLGPRRPDGARALEWHSAAAARRPGA